MQELADTDPYPEIWEFPLSKLSPITLTGSEALAWPQLCRVPSRSVPAWHRDHRLGRDLAAAGGKYQITPFTEQLTCKGQTHLCDNLNLPLKHETESNLI